MVAVTVGVIALLWVETWWHLVDVMVWRDEE